MDQNYSINEILLAVDEIQNKKKKEKLYQLKLNQFKTISQRCLKIL